MTVKTGLRLYGWKGAVTRLGYMANYPSFLDNPCEKKAVFYPLKKKRNMNECTWIKKKWFWAPGKR